jgi:hypothetical protein
VEIWLVGVPLASKKSSSVALPVAAMVTGKAHVSVRTPVSDLTRKLITAIERETKVRALELGEHETLLRALEDCPDDLAVFRGTLLRDLAWCGRKVLPRWTRVASCRRCAWVRSGG